MNSLKHALYLGEKKGLRVFPIKPNFKFPPLIREWQTVRPRIARS